MRGFLIRNAEIDGVSGLDVRIADGRISRIAPNLSRVAGELRIDAGGGALIPGLHDHHIHLFALAAARASVACGPPEVNDTMALARALERAPRWARSEWIRGVGYHESVAGELDRGLLDAFIGRERPARIQHRSGAMWVLNSAALDRLGLGRDLEHDHDGGHHHDNVPEGVEVDDRGQPTGRIYYQDAWLREQIGPETPPDLAGVSRELACCGVTGVTDATPDKGAEELGLLARAIERGELRQRLVAMGSWDTEVPAGAQLELGPVKFMLREPELPDFELLAWRIRQAHERGRPVAIHCVTRTELVVAAEAIRSAGPLEGDRIEHASVAPPELVELLAGLSLCVVTQPNFIWERGDAYLQDVEPRDQPWLYRGRAFLEAGVLLGGGTDAPYGDPDPWVAIRSAVARCTRDGHPMSSDEALTPERALALFTSAPEAPGGAPRRVEAGAIADLCLLDLPWSRARDDLSKDRVVATLRAGELLHCAIDPESLDWAPSELLSRS